MYVRLALTAFVAGWGSMCLITLSPVRLLHPALRQLGVPNGKLPLDLMLDKWSRAVLAAAGVKVTSVKCTGGAAPQRSATGGNRGPQGPPRAPRAPGHFSHFSVFFCRFEGREAFHRVPGDHGSVLTKYQPKRTHLDPVHPIFDDFSSFFRGF